jgi:hypothetical protein
MNTTNLADGPDLTIFHIAHRGMRGDSQRFAALVATLSPAGTRRASAARSWLGGFRSELHEHHTVEDTIFYPALLERVPTVAAALERVDADHRLLDVVLDDLDRRLRALADGDGTSDTVASAARSARELAELISSHLDLEDADLIPLFVRHFTAEEYDALSAKAMKAGRLRELAFAVPWMMDHATTEERDRLLAEAPLPLKVLWRATRRRYARIVGGAFAGSPVPTGAAAPAAAGAARP